jgi:hypothetical protein
MFGHCAISDAVAVGDSETLAQLLAAASPAAVGTVCTDVVSMWVVLSGPERGAAVVRLLVAAGIVTSASMDVALVNLWSANLPCLSFTHEWSLTESAFVKDRIRAVTAAYWPFTDNQLEERNELWWDLPTLRSMADIMLYGCVAAQRWEAAGPWCLATETSAWARRDERPLDQVDVAVRMPADWTELGRRMRAAPPVTRAQLQAAGFLRPTSETGTNTRTEPSMWSRPDDQLTLEEAFDSAMPLCDITDQVAAMRVALRDPEMLTFREAILLDQHSLSFL